VVAGQLGFAEPEQLAVRDGISSIRGKPDQAVEVRAELEPTP
jgi:hypothetical protein